MKHLPGFPESPEIDRQLVMFVLGASTVAAVILFFVDPASWLLIFLPVFTGIAYLLAWRGHVRLASWFAPMAVLAILAILVFRNYGIRDTALLGFPVIIVAGSLLNGRRGTLVFGMVSLVIVTALGAAEMSGFLAQERLITNTVTDYLVVTITIGLTMIVQWAVISRLDEKSRKISQELAERQRAEAALRVSEERYRQISSVASDYTFSTQLDADGLQRIHWVSGAFEAMTGYTLEEYRASGGWMAHLYPEDLEKDWQAFERLNHNQPVVHDIRTLTKQGACMWVRVYAHPVWDETRQKLVGIVGAVQDINERKLVEEETMYTNRELQRRIQELSALNAVAQAGASARSEDEMLEAVVETLYRGLFPDMVAIGLWNEAEGVLRTHPKANRGIPDNIDQNSLAARPHQGVVGHVLAQRAPYRVRDANDQRYRPLNPLIRSEMCVPILAGDRLVGVLDVESRQQDAFTDSDEHLLVTVAGQLASALERLRAEQQLRRINVELEERVAERTAMLEATNKELEAFSYTISHDLRAPLRRINSFAHVLIEDFAAILPSEAQIYLEKIISSSVKMAQLIDGVLDLSRLGKKSLTRTEVNLNALVRGVVDSLSAEQPNRQIEWVLADLPVVNADPLLLQQVFTNLLGNAVKYTSKRAQACIEVGVFQQKGETVFFVRDNGVGFDMKYANNLFSVFQRLHSEDEFEGSGIGLATVRRIIERHGGRVWAESAVDEGATFYLTWF